jgi:hypothetical protein
MKKDFGLFARLGTRAVERIKGALRSAYASVSPLGKRAPRPDAERCEQSSALPGALSADDLGGDGASTPDRRVLAPSLVGDPSELETLRSEVTRLTARVDELELELAYAQARTTALQRDDWERMLATGEVPSRHALKTVLRLIARANGMQGGGGALHWS